MGPENLLLPGRSAEHDGRGGMGRQSRHAEEMLPSLRRHGIQVLLLAGFGAQKDATRTSASVDTVRRVLREDAVTHVDDPAAHQARDIGPPSKTTPFAEKVTTWLREEPGLPTQELLRRAKEKRVCAEKDRVLCPRRRRETAAREMATISMWSCSWALPPCRRRAPPPAAMAASRDLERRAQDFDGVQGLLRVDDARTRPALSREEGPRFFDTSRPVSVAC
jgi:hypothetical protein